MRIFLGVNGFPIFMILFSIPMALALGFICHIVPRIIGKIFAYLFSIFLLVAYSVQITYCNIYGTYASITQLGMGAEAIDTFGGAAMLEVRESLVAILFLFIPLFILGIYTVRHMPDEVPPYSYKYYLTVMVAIVELYFISFIALPLGGDEAYSPNDVYKHTFVLDKSEQHFGVLVTAGMELKMMYFGENETEIHNDVIPDVIVSVTPTETPTPTVTPANTLTHVPTATPTPTPTPYPKYAYDIDFKALSESTDNANLKKIDAYFEAQEPTTKNEYTGMYEGYNLIVICCESYSPYMLSEELTPTLWKLSHEGFVFNNFYNTISDNTSNSEYALNLSLLPDVSLVTNGGKGVYNSFTCSIGNYLPFAYGNMLSKEGYRSFAFHNFVGSYYKREETHPNMGYKFVCMENGFDYEKDWPTSDVNMITQSEKFMYQKDKNGNITPFVSYFLTFSGHMPYYFSSAAHWFTGNDMAVKNREYVDALPYPENSKAYLASQLELEFAVTELVDSLKKQGIADKTLLVITGDHYPYSLGLWGLEQIVGDKLDPEYDKYKGSFILWSEGMETKEIDTPCCTLDIMPTLYNLLGVEYDSRLLMGTDIFSDAQHAAILMDRSFITEYAKYNANTGKVIVKDGVTLPEGYIQAWTNRIKDKFSISKLMLYNDYYRHLNLE